MRLAFALIIALPFALSSWGCSRAERFDTLASNSNSGDSNSGNSSDSNGSSDNSNSDGSGGSSDGSSRRKGKCRKVNGKPNKHCKKASAQSALTGATAPGAAALIVASGAAVALDAEQIEVARAYLADNRRQLRQDLSRGHGPILEQLAQAQRLPGHLRPRFGAALQAARSSLDALLREGSVSAGATTRFARAVAAAVRAQPELASYLEAASRSLAEDA